MNSLRNRKALHSACARQRGVVLFFALIALVVMCLAAVALIRSVDTSTLIAGNLAFRQSATSSGDSGIEAAITALAGYQAAMKTANSNVLSDPANTFNNTNAANGYYSYSNPALDLTDPANWVNGSSMLVGTDASGNEVRFIIERMCRSNNALPYKLEEPGDVPPKTACLFSAPAVDNNGQQVPLPSDICLGAGCPAAGQSPEYRITSRTAGPGNTFSYVQAFVY